MTSRVLTLHFYFNSVQWSINSCQCKMGQAIASTSIWQFQKTEISIAKGHAVMEENNGLHGLDHITPFLCGQ